MRVKYVCDCCDSVFAEFEANEDWDKVDDLSLTGKASQDIILQDREDLEVCVSSTCQECMQELDEYEPGDGLLRFFKAPLLH